MDTTAALGISDTPYAQRTRELIKLITQLRGVGAQADVDLPRIAVIGNQSAGKSSLVEAISGISVPRASGTCTRCPMECRLIHSPEEPWKCQVSLRTEYSDDTGRRLADVRERKFGPIVTDPTTLEDVLRRAQLAILNPSVDHGKFVDFDLSKLGTDPPLGSSRQLQFSKNVVCLDLSGPDVTDLSFIDLPGIISNVAPGEDRGNIELVRNLVTEHIQGNCLILLTLTMRDDIENQSAAFLAKQVDPKGRRTIGVLTKPDTLQAGEEGIWLNVLEGRRHPLTQGYYMTKQPAAKELSERLSFEEARAREKAFFEETAPWSTSTATKRLGTPNLTKNLSRLLSGLIDQTLPKLRLDATRSREATRTQLAKLPPPISDNPSSELLRMITRFATDFRNYSNGASDFASLIQKCKPAYTEFHRAVKNTAPDFRPYTLKEKRKYSNLSVRFKDPEDGSSSSDESSDEEEDASERFEDDIDLDDAASDQTGGGRQKRKPMYVDEVQKYIHSSLTRELPFNVPFSAKEGLIKQCIKDWEALALEAFKVVREVAAEHMDTLVEEHFGRFARSNLLDNVYAIIQRLIEKRQEETTERIKWLMRLEHRPYTQNQHYLTTYRDKFLSKYRGERRKKNKSVADHAGAASPMGGRSASPIDGRSSPMQQYPQELPQGQYPGQQGQYPGQQQQQQPQRGTLSRHPSRSNSLPVSAAQRGMSMQQPQQMAPQPQQMMPQQMVQQQNLDQVLSQLAAAGYPVQSTADLERLFASDPYEEVLVVCSEVRAYWQVSYKRVIDMVPLAIDEDFLCGLAQDTQDVLMQGLGLAGIDANARAGEYLAEDADIMAEREELMAKLARVEDVWDRLAHFKS